MRITSHQISNNFLINSNNSLLNDRLNCNKEKRLNHTSFTKVITKISNTAVTANELKNTIPSDSSNNIELVNTLTVEKTDQKKVNPLNNTPLLYSDAFKRISEKYNIIIGVRSPNPLGETLLKEGYPSKNFHMKGKSSVTDPTAEFITAEPRYSKVSVSDYKKQQAGIDKAILLGAKSVDLYLSQTRIEELLQSNNLIMLSQTDGHYAAQYPGGLFDFFIEKSGKILDSNKHPVKVMINPPESNQVIKNLKPITADYDLFSIIPFKNQSNNIRRLSIPPKQLRGNASLDFLKPQAINNQAEDINMGNTHHFATVIIEALNKEIKHSGYTGGKLVWHNDETGNPYSPRFDPNDMPIFFLPTGESFQIYNKKELVDFYAQVKTLGFMPEYSPRIGF